MRKRKQLRWTKTKHPSLHCTSQVYAQNNAFLFTAPIVSSRFFFLSSRENNLALHTTYVIGKQSSLRTSPSRSASQWCEENSSKDQRNKCHQIPISTYSWFWRLHKDHTFLVHSIAVLCRLQPPWEKPPESRVNLRDYSPNEIMAAHGTSHIGCVHGSSLFQFTCIHSALRSRWWLKETKLITNWLVTLEYMYM